MPNIDLANYDQDLRALTGLVTDVNAAHAGRRIQRAGSLVTHNVNVISGNAQVTLIMGEDGLYIQGFTNPTGTYWFQGYNNGAGNQLHYGCGYVGGNSLGIFTAPAATADTLAVRSLASIDQSVRDLAAFAGGNDIALKLKLVQLVYLVSESIRFSIVYRKMVNVCQAGATYTFEEFRDWVQNWNTISGGVIPAGTNQARLFTWHH